MPDLAEAVQAYLDAIADFKRAHGDTQPGIYLNIVLLRRQEMADALERERVEIRAFIAQVREVQS